MNWLWLSNVVEPHVGSGGARFAYACETFFADHPDETVIMFDLRCRRPNYLELTVS